MHDGANARVWVQIKVRTPIERGDDMPSPLPLGTKLFTGLQGFSDRLSPDDMSYQRAVTLGAEVFETLEDVNNLYPDFDELSFYTWGDDQCCLPAGTTSATLRGDFAARLAEGTVLIFKEVVGPKTGAPEDADPAHRCAVRLTSVAPDQDEAGGWFEAVDKTTATPIKLTQITWGAEDALPFPLCLSTESAQNVSVALGNIILADHGGTIDAPEYLGQVFASEIVSVTRSGDPCESDQRAPLPPRFRPRLQWQPLTQQGSVSIKRTEGGVSREFTLPFDDQASATATFTVDRASLIPAITVAETETPDPPAACEGWKPKRDLLNSGHLSQEIVVETRNDGYGVIRFGDGKNGKRPEVDKHYWACYRVGNGARGNVGAGAIEHILTDDEDFIGVTNPMPARGGLEPETLEEVRQRAPVAFRTLERAVTPDDYAEIAQRHPEVQRAVATFRWTGSWHTVFVTIDRVGGREIDDDFKGELVRFIEPYRMAGYDVEIDGPRFVALDVEMTVCVKPDYFRSSVLTALQEVFSPGVLPDGRLGVFNPDNFTFGQTIYLSPLYAAALAVDGVQSVEITKFAPVGDSTTTALDNGKLTLSRLQIARLANDRNFPDRGVFRLTVEGGK